MSGRAVLARSVHAFRRESVRGSRVVLGFFLRVRLCTYKPPITVNIESTKSQPTETMSYLNPTWKEAILRFRVSAYPRTGTRARVHPYPCGGTRARGYPCTQGTASLAFSQRDILRFRVFAVPLWKDTSIQVDLVSKTDNLERFRNTSDQPS